MDETNPFLFDEETFRQLSSIESSICALHLDSQGEFIAIINAIEMQLESPQPEYRVLKLLTQSLLALAEARLVDKPRLCQRVHSFLSRFGDETRPTGTR